jgi:hypothetical protein
VSEIEGEGLIVLASLDCVTPSARMVVRVVAALAVAVAVFL